MSLVKASFMKTVPTKSIEILWQKYYITLEVLYYLSNFINTPNIFTNSTKARSKRFDTWFHRQVKFLVQVVAMGRSFSGRRSSCPDWPSWCLPGPLSHCLGHCTPLHTGLCSPLWKERETSCHLVIGGERGVRGRTGEDYDAIIIKICEDGVWSLNIEMLVTWWDIIKTFFIALHYDTGTFIADRAFSEFPLVYVQFVQFFKCFTSLPPPISFCLHNLAPQWPPGIADGFHQKHLKA